MKRKANISSNGGLTFQNISFRIRNKKEEEQATITMEHPIHEEYR